MSIPLSEKRLKKYGDRDSQFIEPIGDKCEIHISRKSITEKRLLSVPYDANVSFIAYRKDLLGRIKNEFATLGKESNALNTRMAGGLDS